MSKPLSDNELQSIRDKFQYNEVTGILYRKFETLPKGKALKNSVGRLIKKKKVTMLKAVGTKSPSGFKKTSICVDGKNRTLMVHSICWFLHAGEWPEELGHINGDKQDNRIINLCLATKGLNQQKQPKKLETESQYKGIVFQYQGNKRYIASRISGKHIGFFATEEEAARAYDQKAKEIYGELAFLNFPAEEKVPTSSSHHIPNIVKT